MKSALPKVLHRIGGRPMLGHVLAVARALSAARTVVVTAPDAAPVAALAKEWGAETVIQDRQLGTGHAVLAARTVLGDFSGNVLVLFGDAPLLTAETLGRLVSRLNGGADIAALGFRAADPTGYGRMITEGDALLRIVEQKDATPEERQITLAFAGMLAGTAATMFELLQKVGNQNAQGEFYLTDLIAIARGRGLSCAVGGGPSERDARRQFPCPAGRSRNRVPGAPARAS